MYGGVAKHSLLYKRFYEICNSFNGNLYGIFYEIVENISGTLNKEELKIDGNFHKTLATLIQMKLLIKRSSFWRFMITLNYNTIFICHI